MTGGNGVTVSRYARGVVISNNEMHRIGDTGVIVVGDLKYDTPKPWLHVDGNYPMGTQVVGNLIHELGVFTKQTAGFFQALAANSTVSHNVIINGPRSGVNFNDAAFGGNVIEMNLMANLVRETTDHGPCEACPPARPPVRLPACPPARPPARLPAAVEEGEGCLVICWLVI